MRRSPNSLRSSEPKPLTVARLRLKLLRRSTSTKPAVPSFLARCSPLSPNSPCSSPRRSSSSRRKKRRRPSLTRQLPISIAVYLPPRMPRWNGNVTSATPSAAGRRSRTAASAKPSRHNSPQPVLRRRPFLVPTLTCPRTSRFLGPMVYSRLSSLASLALKCVISLSLSSRRSSTERPPQLRS